MTSKTGFDWQDSAPHWIFMFVGAYLAVHLLVLYLWTAAGQAFPIQGTSDCTSALSATAMAGVELWLCVLVLRSFPAGTPLRPVWMMITTAAAARAAGGVLAQLLGTDWLLNPLTWTGRANSGLIEPIRYYALAAAGPLRLAVLAAAMLVVLRILRRFGFWVRPSGADWAICGVVCLFTLCRFTEAGMSSLAGRLVNPENWISLAGLPVLCVLSLEAMLLRQSVIHMGSGLVSRCWAAFAFGVFLTTGGELALWVVPHYSQAWPLAVIDSLRGFPTAAVFALAPAYMLAAQRHAGKPPANPAGEIPLGVPLLAR